MSIDKSRRRFLRTSLGSSAAVAGLSVFPPSIRRALAIEAHNETRSIQDVQHVVMVMMENRSFDSYFGTFRGVRGYGDRFPIPLANGQNAFWQTDADGNTQTPYHLDETAGNAQRAGGTPHTWPDAQAAWDHGRMNRWPATKHPLSMGYYNTEEVEFQRALADAFTVCDAYHCSMHTGTIPNRLYYWTGTNGPSGDGVAAMINEFNGGNDVGPSSEGWTWMTYADRLEAAGVRWKVYQSLADNFGCNEMMSFQHWRAAMEAMPEERRPKALPDTTPAYDPAIDDALSPLAKGFCNTMPDGLLQTLRDDVANGTLPQVSWIIPPSTYSEHPGPSSPAQGGWYVQAVLDALTANPQVWSKTVLLVNYDENDGFFDHLPPPSAPSYNDDGTLAGASTLSDADMAFEYYNYTPATSKQPAADGKPFGPGPRVPLWVISPWSRGGWVDSQVFDHTSILLFLEKRFGVVEPQVGAYRRAVCGDLTSAFDFKRPNERPIPTLEGRTTQAAADALAASQQTQAAIPVPTDPVAPLQARGIRPSRALPYRLYTMADVDTDAQRLTLTFGNDSRDAAGAVFHVYDKLHLDRIPRRYVVEAGKTLTGDWDLGDDLGAYDLWVLGPNGYHRAYRGATRELSAAVQPEVEIACDNHRPLVVLTVRLRNDGRHPCRFRIDAMAYRNGGPWAVNVPPRSEREFRWPVGDDGHWYDFEVSCDASASFKRRFAGRIETGGDTISDPAMGLG
ncbi:phosphocholine-specific phospholipase C [Solimonas marina]|uniref:phospholipase C n=1 Tax=Solimonas marina TaxID=2714601 RepID=A0A969WC28_9GAMM|nr:phospholipase C, phosphocholine-specific [Solimonas marina]NKF24626.1 phospholipase C, phosphocholine-specific [Solimonas marina]